MTVVRAHLSSVREPGWEEQHHGVSRPHSVSHPVDSAQFLSAPPAYPAETVLLLLQLLFSKDPDLQHLSYNTELVTTCAIQACFGTAR